MIYIPDSAFVKCLHILVKMAKWLSNCVPNDHHWYGFDQDFRNEYVALDNLRPCTLDVLPFSQVKTCQVVHPKCLNRFVAHRTKQCDPFYYCGRETYNIRTRAKRWGSVTSVPRPSFRRDRIYRSTTLHKVWGVGFRMRITHAYAPMPRRHIEFQCLELGYQQRSRTASWHAQVCPPECSNFAPWYWSSCSGPQVSSTNFNGLCFLCMNWFHLERCTRFSTRIPWI